MSASHPFSIVQIPNRAHLRILETTDLHGHIFPYDYYTDQPRGALGLALAASLIQEMRADATNSLTFDNGDFLQGNPMGDYIAHERGLENGALHPIISAMNAVGFDGSTLGNHEFNYGLEFLMRAVAGAEFPIVSANVARHLAGSPEEDQTLFEPYTILERTLTDGCGIAHPFRVGVIGFLPPQIMIWDRRHLEGRVQTREIVEAAEAHVPRLRAAGADIVIALSHSGIGTTQRLATMENACVPLAAVDGIDVVLGGHTHQVFPGPCFRGMPNVDPDRGTIHGKPAVMAGFWGSHLGIVDLLLERKGDTWRIVEHESTARPVTNRTKSEASKPVNGIERRVLDAVHKDHTATLEYVRRSVGKTERPLHSYFTLVAQDAALQFVSVAQKWYVAQLLDGTPYADLPLLSAAAPFKAGGRGGPDFFTDVPAGDLAIKNIADLYLYPNTVRAVKVTGAQLKDWLERSAGTYNQIAPGSEDADLLDPEFPSYNFDVIVGVTYEIDLSSPSKFTRHGALADCSACRIVNLRYNGQPIQADMEFVIATNNYRAGGGGDFPGAKGDTVVLEAPDTHQDVLTRYIVERGTICPETEPNWRFKPLGSGTTAQFLSGQNGKRHLGDLGHLKIEVLGPSKDGFMRYRIQI